MMALRAIALDVDGVLTDGGVWWGPDGAEWKRFSFDDIMGVSLARQAGLTVTLISGEDSPLVDRFAAKLELNDITKGCKDKASALRAFAERHGLALQEICFMGDDVNDLAAMELAGLSAAPANARAAALRKADLVTRANGGNGAVRELVDLILAGELPCAAGNHAGSRVAGGAGVRRERLSPV
jgi:3-deoxy-D-manno-octulosonate 8-phosphate phosphatase (KDO 8-P phosphatase)